MGQLFCLSSWFTKKPCPLCGMKDEYIETLKHDLKDAKERERAAIDRLLMFQGKPSVSSKTMSEEQMGQLLDPFAEVPVSEQSKQFIAPSIFDDLLETKKP